MKLEHRGIIIDVAETPKGWRARMTLRSDLSGGITRVAKTGKSEQDVIDRAKAQIDRVLDEVGSYGDGSVEDWTTSSEFEQLSWGDS